MIMNEILIIWLVLNIMDTLTIMWIHRTPRYYAKYRNKLPKYESFHTASWLANGVIAIVWCLIKYVI